MNVLEAISKFRMSSMHVFYCVEEVASFKGLGLDLICSQAPSLGNLIKSGGARLSNLKNACASTV